jgi:hypothetical protein
MDVNYYLHVCHYVIDVTGLPLHLFHIMMDKFYLAFGLG